MRVLVVERTSAGQTDTARNLESLDRIDKDILDLSIGLADQTTVLERLAGCDVLLLGASLGEESMVIAEDVKRSAPEIEVLVVLPRALYLSGAFRSALARGARKVLSEDASSLELVQELMSIREGFRAQGRVREGRVIVVVQAKGGIGATSTCAALAEVCSNNSRRTLLWDLDIETRDLSRAAVTHGDQASVVREMFTGEREISRENLRQAAIPVSQYASVLPPPDDIAASLDFVGHVEAIDIAQAVVALARYSYDTVIVDVGSRFSPAAGAIMQAADSVVVMVDDSILGLSAAKFFAPILQSVVGRPGSILFLCSGISISKDELARHVQEREDFRENSWSLPVIPFDPAASQWPGSGKTLYALGRRQTKRAFEELACALKLIDRPVTLAERGSESIRSWVYCASTAALMVGLSSPLRALLQRVIHP
jgi:Mrp family chromosome partitioning ATPase